MSARKVKFVLDKLIPRQAKFKKTVSPHKNYFYPGNKVLFKTYKNNMAFWEVGTIKQRIGELVHNVQGPKNFFYPQTPYEPAQEMPFEWIWGITTKYLRRANRRNIRSFRPRHSSSLSGSTTLAKKKKICATTRRKSQEAEVLIVLLFLAFFPRKKKENSWKRGIVRPKLTCIMDSSSTMLLAKYYPNTGALVVVVQEYLKYDY